MEVTITNPTTSPREERINVALELKFGRQKQEQDQGNIDREIFVRPDGFLCGNIRSTADSSAAEREGVRLSGWLPQLADEMEMSMRNWIGMG